MHACGHDFHAAAVLGADWLLKKQEAELSGKVMLITVTQFHGGNTWNVIPGKVQLEGTVRTKTPEARSAGLIERQAPASLGGEDFAYYLEKIPGMFSLIGTGVGPVNHNPKFLADPQALFPAVDYMARLAQDALRQQVWRR